MTYAFVPFTCLLCHLADGWVFSHPLGLPMLGSHGLYAVLMQRYSQSPGSDDPFKPNSEN